MKSSNQVTAMNYADANGISWNAILAGVLVVIITSAIFNLLGMSIGLTLFHPTQEIVPTLTWGTIIWVMISAFLSMYVGGWVTTYFGIEKTRTGGALSGIITSGVSLLIFFVITATVSGSILSTTFSALTSIISTSASGVASSANAVSSTVKGINKIAPELGDNVRKSFPDLNPIIEKINKKAEELIPMEGGNTEEKIKKIKTQLENFVDRYLDSLGKENTNLDEITNDFNKFLVETTGKTPEEITKTLDEWKSMYLEAKEKAHQTLLKTSELITKTLSRLALVNFFLILISLISAALGGISGMGYREGR